MSSREAQWPLDIETRFVNLLVDMVTDGRIVNDHVHPDLWVSIVSEFSTMIGTIYTAKQCSDKYKRLRINHHEFSELLRDETGLGWDPISNTIHATETQWQQFLRVGFLTCTLLSFVVLYKFMDQ
jgi:transcriptional regulator with AAA-type ATPase domain